MTASSRELTAMPKNKSHCHMFDTMYIPVYNCTIYIYIYYTYYVCMYIYKERESSIVTELAVRLAAYFAPVARF